MATTNLQKTFDRNLVSLQAYLPDDKEIKSIIRMCGLQPVGWREWLCPFGYALQVYKTKISLRQKKVKIKHKDLYLFAHPSTLIFTTQLIAFTDDRLLLVGDDKKLRVYEPHDIDEWRRVSPLQISLSSLRSLVSFETTDLTFDAERAYLPVACKVPPTTEALEYLHQANKEICKSRLQTLIEVF